MNKVYKKVLPLIMLLSVTWSMSMAQNQEDIAIFLSAQREDASKLVEAYLQPTIKSLSYGMTGGWYNTAATHKTLGIDFGVTVNLANIPTSENYFNPDELDFETTEFLGNQDNPEKGAPTFFGPKDATLYQAVYDPGDGQGTRTINFNGPEGLGVKDEIGFSAVPVPVAQLGIGIIKNTDLKFRFIPQVNAGSSKLSMFGVGIQHDIKQHIRGIKLLPFDLSILVAYNSLKGETDLSNDDLSDSRPDSDDGMGVYKFNSLVYQLLISKRLAVVTFFGGVGYTNINTKVNINGTFEIDTNTTPITITDPVSMTIKNKSMCFTAGMRLKLGPIYFVGDYTLQKYKMINFGIGFSIRENKNLL